MRRWLDTLTNRTVLLLLIGIGLVHLASLYAYRAALDHEASAAGDARLADRMLTIKRAVMSVRPEEREPVAHELSGGAVEAHWSRTEHAAPGGAGSADWEPLKRKLHDMAPELAEGQVIVGSSRRGQSDPHLAFVSMQLPDSSWVNVSVFSRLNPPTSRHGTILSTTLMALGVVGLSILIMRWITRPLSAFADAAQRLYSGAEHVPVREDGPREVRELASAFNGMQDRIKRLIDDRTQALAAVSHDLKTPLTRLRLKTEGMADGAEAAAIRSDLDEMEAMIDQTLAYLRGGRDDEPVRRIDLAALIQTLADEAADAGGRVSAEGASPLVVEGRALALRRAVSNVLQNALKYGGRADVAWRREGDDGVIRICDAGPGIPPEDMDRALEPFVRLEGSRSRQTGGFGLGLAIARGVIKGHGGEIALANRAEGGLCVIMRLPAAGPPAGGA
jgi:two-component system, OmpR family, sensor kinase